MPEPIVMPNEGHARVEYCPRWGWSGGEVTYGPISASRDRAEPYDVPVSVRFSELAERTVTISPWEPVLPAGVLRLNQIGGWEYGGITVIELGDGVVEGYNVVAFTDDPEKAVAAVRAHFAMVHTKYPNLLEDHHG